METDLTVLMAFFAGVLSFLSPCTLPLFPLYLSYITGASVGEIKTNKSKNFRMSLIAHSVVFLLGASVIYMSLGLGASYLGELFAGLMTGATGTLIQRIAGLVVIVMGLTMAGWLTIPTLLKDKRKMNTKSGGYVSSFFIGLGFAAGWTPCIGPIFSSILLIGISTGTPPLAYLTVYIIGFALPFLIMSLFLSKMDNILKHSEKLMKIGGILMVIMGVLLLTGGFEYISENISILMQNTPFEQLG